MLVYTKFYNNENTNKNISSVSNEKSPILITRFLGDE